MNNRKVAASVERAQIRRRRNVGLGNREDGSGGEDDGARDRSFLYRQGLREERKSQEERGYCAHAWASEGMGSLGSDKGDPTVEYPRIAPTLDQDIG